MIEAAEGIAAGFRLCGVYAKGKPCVRVGKHHAGYTQILIAISDAFTVFVKLRQQLVGDMRGLPDLTVSAASLPDNSGTEISIELCPSL